MLIFCWELGRFGCHGNGRGFDFLEWESISSTPGIGSMMGSVRNKTGLEIEFLDGFTLAYDVAGADYRVCASC